MNKLVNLEVLYCDSNSLTQLPNLDKLVNLTVLTYYNNNLPEPFNGSLTIEELKSLVGQLNRNKKIDELI